MNDAGKHKAKPAKESKALADALKRNLSRRKEQAKHQGRPKESCATQTGDLHLPANPDE